MRPPRTRPIQNLCDIIEEVNTTSALCLYAPEPLRDVISQRPEGVMGLREVRLGTRTARGPDSRARFLNDSSTQDRTQSVIQSAGFSRLPAWKAMKTLSNSSSGPTIIRTVTATVLLLNLVGLPLGASAEAETQPGQWNRRLHPVLETDLAPELGGYMLLNNDTILVPTFRNGHEVKIAVHELSTGAHDSIIVMVHGVFSWSGTWHCVVPELAKNHDIWLIDLPGCGWSDKPHPRKLAADGYSPQALADRVMQAVESRLAKRRVGGATPRVWLVGHSLGSTILLRAVMMPELRQRHAGTLDAVAGLVLLCPCDTGLTSVPPAFQPLLSIKGWQVTVGHWLGVLRKEISQAVLDGYDDPRRATEEEVELLIALLRRPACRLALVAMLRQAVPFDEESQRLDWPEAEHCGGYYSQIKEPCLIVWGERDEVLPESTGHKIKDKIPGAELIELPRCGHSIPRECPRRVSTIIDDFITQKALAGRLDPATKGQGIPGQQALAVGSKRPVQTDRGKFNGLTVGVKQ